MSLDAEAFSALAGRPASREREVRAAMRAADRLGRDVVVPTVILAELYRGPRHSQLIDSCLSRETGVRNRDTDRHLARLVGGVLAGAGAGSDHLADAHAVAVAVDGEHVADVVPSGELDRLRETIEVLSDSELVQELRAGLKDLQTGHMVSADQVAADLRARSTTA